MYVDRENVISIMHILDLKQDLDAPELNGHGDLDGGVVNGGLNGDLDVDLKAPKVGSELTC